MCSIKFKIKLHINNHKKIKNVAMRHRKELI